MNNLLPLKKDIHLNYLQVFESCSHKYRRVHHDTYQMARENDHSKDFAHFQVHPSFVVVSEMLSSMNNEKDVVFRNLLLTEDTDKI